MPGEIHTCARCGTATVSMLLPEPIVDAAGWETTTELACIAPPEWCEEHHLIGREGVERGLIETLRAREPKPSLLLGDF